MLNAADGHRGHFFFSRRGYEPVSFQLRAGPTWGQGCLPSALGVRVRRASGKISVTDGPFIETKELVGGFAILKANSKAEAIELARNFLQNAGDGECELRQLYEAGEGNCTNHVEHEAALTA